MRNDNNIIVFDFETGGLDVKTLEVLSIAGKVYNGITLQPFPKEEGEFYSLMKPLDFNNLSQKALDVNKITRDELATAPEREVVLKQFVKFCNKFHKGKFKSPIVGGKNIKDFDIPILNRVLDSHSLKYPFENRIVLDLEDQLYMFLNQTLELPNVKMDTIRPFFGLSMENAHNALQDCRQIGEIIMRFLKLCRHFERSIKFKDSCKDVVF